METPQAQARRALELEAAKRAEADYVAKYPRGTITPENFDAADDYRAERHNYWKNKLGIAP